MMEISDYWLISLLTSSPASGWLSCTLAGVLGALINLALEGRPLVLPRMSDGALYLGFVGNLIICITVAFIIDGSFAMAFFAALIGTCILRKLKTKLEQTFAKEIDRLHLEE